MRRWLCLIVLLALPLMAELSAPQAPALQAQGKDAPAAHKLLEDVKEFDKEGTPGALNLWGDAEALIAGTNDGVKFPLVGVTKAGKGQLLALGHPGYIGKLKDGRGRTQLITNFLRAELKSKSNPSVVGGAKEVADLCTRMGWSFIDAGERWHEKLKHAHALVLAPGAAGTKEQLEAAHDFLKKGGVVVVGFAGWIYTQYWAKGKDLVRDAWVNQLTMPYGISYGDSYIDAIVDPSSLDKDHLAELNASVCFGRLDDLADKRKGKIKESDRKRALKEYGKRCAAALRFSPLEKPGFAGEVAKKLPKEPKVTKNDPVSFDTPFERLAVVLWQRNLKLTPVDARKPAPSVDAFPGQVSGDAPRTNTYFRVDLATKEWLSTGMYAPAGEVVTISVPKEALELGLRVRIGANKDLLYSHRDTWFRFPEISEVHDVTGPLMRLNNPFGGLIYIENPQERQGITLDFGIVGAVRAPYFVLGKTDNKQWVDEIRDFPAPWAELECHKVILTVPSRLIRKLDNPEALMRFWDRTRDYYAELSTKPLQSRPERMVVDVQISNGYMHAGYPIMMQTYGEADRYCVDLDALSSRPSEIAWGLWHELGHNHQEKDWTFSNTTEVTVNLYSLYVIERITGQSEV
ncbi:MAG: M60 family metallopeptidase, partial [Planctomycetes bacterium]|nr:M60 family metallopeptidase [Planctomycetota bacterium]